MLRFHSLGVEVQVTHVVSTGACGVSRIKYCLMETDFPTPHSALSAAIPAGVGFGGAPLLMGQGRVQASHSAFADL